MEERIKNIEDLEQYLKERIESVEKCYEELIKPYYIEDIKIINVSGMNKKEKEEFINKKNCLLVQKYSYEEILEKIAQEED